MTAFHPLRTLGWPGRNFSKPKAGRYAAIDQKVATGDERAVRTHQKCALTSAIAILHDVIRPLTHNFHGRPPPIDRPSSLCLNICGDPRVTLLRTHPLSGRPAMNVEQMLQQTGAIDAISRELGVDPATARAGAAALLPQILSGFQNPTAPAETQPALSGLGGLGGLLGTIGGLGGGGLLDNVTSSQPTEVDKGNQILGQIFGSKDGQPRHCSRRRRTVRGRAVAAEEDASCAGDVGRRLRHETSRSGKR